MATVPTWETIYLIAAKELAKEVKNNVPVFDTNSGNSTIIWEKLSKLISRIYWQHKVYQFPLYYYKKFMNLIRLERNFNYVRYPGYFEEKWTINKELYKYM